ncbi:hypothetical protein ACFL9S_05995 [Erwinia sp. AnSW2-5]|uniref:hypothetical protein n=1 Tax=Erwinia sp. AnSW2-5 TaxID=3367692 RepID=UPI00385F1B9B
MYWKGIPFELSSNQIAERVSLALESIPKIVIDSPPDYTSTISTVIVSIIAGLIPAAIAIWTFKRNADNTRKERASQEDFLVKERAAQHDFLQTERLAQQESLAQDREIQLLISKQSFNMQVLSANRQAWINSLRDYSAEFVAAAHQAISDTVDYAFNVNFGNKINDTGARESNFIAREAIRIRMNNSLGMVRLLSTKINMMLNPLEDDFENVSGVFGRILNLNSNALKKVIDDGVVYEGLFPELNLATNDFTRIIQCILKKEWERVKLGV